MNVPPERRERLSRAVAGEGLDQLIVADGHDLRWLTGFSGTSGLALCPADPGEPGLFVTDFRYVEQAGEQLGDGWTVERARRDLLGAGLGEATGGRELGRVGFDPGQVTVAQLADLTEALGTTAELVEAPGLASRLREVKDEEEVERIGAATRLADEALESVLAAGLEGRTEREVAVALELAIIGAGAESLSFPPIVAAGAHGALPHAEPRDVRITAGEMVTIDWGATLDGYCSDCTRTFAVGEVGSREREVYGIVNDARAAGIAALAPGRTGREVDASAREVIDAAGYGEHFGHGLGHGVGLDVHEEPRLSPRGSTHPLEEGTVVTVEPGVYLPGSFGVRIEDLVVVTGGEPLVLTSMDRELVDAG